MIDSVGTSVLAAGLGGNQFCGVMVRVAFRHNAQISKGGALVVFRPNRRDDICDGPQPRNILRQLLLT
jgi:hypothetical protein